jgi:hypothetical protein
MKFQRLIIPMARWQRRSQLFLVISHACTSYSCYRPSVLCHPFSRVRMPVGTRRVMGIGSSWGLGSRGTKGVMRKPNGTRIKEPGGQARSTIKKHYPYRGRKSEQRL